jgi:DivIVA domain-containing protein
VRDPLPEELRDPSFPAAVRGYDRHAVDAYVQRVNRVIAELQVAGSPAAAVRHALDRVGEQTSGILHRARETAEEITKTAREEAEETTARAKAEAQEITIAAQRGADEATDRARTEAAEVVMGARGEADEIIGNANAQSEETLAQARSDAEARTRQAEEQVASLHAEADGHLRSLQADIAAVSDERQRVLDDVRRLTARLEAAIAEAADERPIAGDNGGEPQPERSAADKLGSELT